MISYKSLYSLGTGKGDSKGDLIRFRSVDRTGFNSTDSIDTRFFKLLFYFFNDDPGDTMNVDWYNGGPTGLLAPTWLGNPKSNEYYKYNSAWSYLKNNLEDERADILKSFISLLSQISSESPWYFKQIDGIDEALGRENWVVPEERKKITITCLNDPVDHRISSLLSMYRSIVWSHLKKCEILPANLRKFDMGLFIFSGLFNGLHVKHNKLSGDNDWYNIDYDNDSEEAYASNYKYIEFHNCEISLDSIKSGYAGLNNENGFEQEFKIDIFFDDCYENEYNPFILKTFGDFFVVDSFRILDRTEQGDIITPSNSDKSYVNQMSDEDINEYINNLGFEGMNMQVYGMTDEELNIFNAMEKRLNPFGNVKEQDQSLPTRVRKNMNDMTVPISEKGIKQQLKDQYNDVKNKIGNGIKNLKNWKSSAVINQIKTQVKNAAERALLGDLGNFYGKGMGLRGMEMAVKQEIDKQVSTLANKISGNINSSATKISRSISETITNPINKVSSTTGNMIGTAADLKKRYPEPSVAKYEGGNMNVDRNEPSSMIGGNYTKSSVVNTTSENLGNFYPKEETTIEHAGGNFYPKEETIIEHTDGNFYPSLESNTYGESENIGNFYVNSNSIGVNRLNSNLGNMHQSNSMINNL